MLACAIGAAVTWLCYCGIGTTLVIPLIYALLKFKPEHSLTPILAILLFLITAAVIPACATLLWWNDEKGYGRIGR